MKKLFYASSIFYPSRYANRLQTLQTAEALAATLGKDFVLGCNSISETGSLYTHDHVDFGSRRSPILAFKQLRYVIAKGFDVIYSREYTILFMMYLYNVLLFRTPLSYALEVHDTYDDFRFGFVLRRAARIFCLTSGLAEDLRSRFGVKAPIVILPDAVNAREFHITEDKRTLRAKFHLPPEARIASYVGSVGVHPWKGVDVFLDSYDDIDDPTVHYVVAGVQDEDLDALRSEHAGKGITFLGWLTRRDAAEIMALSDVLVLPNKSGPLVSERYTSPMKLFEYMASGTPVVASDLPSIREIANEDSAVLVRANDSRALARGVEEVFTDPAAARARATQAIKKAEHHSWERRADTIVRHVSATGAPKA